MILVTGATGSVGRYVVQELIEAGYPVRALSRNPEKANFPAGVEAAAGDLANPESLREALNGVDKLLWVLPENPDFSLPQIARQSGVRHIVLLSALAVEFGPDNAIALRHQQAEQAVRESGAEWTFLRPGGFMANALLWAESIRSAGAVRAPFGDNSSAIIDSRDIAAVAAQTLRMDGHAGKIYTLSGPEALSPREQVRIIGELLGRELDFAVLPAELAREFMVRRMPAEIVDAVLDLNRRNYTAVSPTVEEVTGRPPFTFRQWAEHHIDAFR